MKTDLSNFSGWVIYEKGTIVATYDKENFHRYYDQEEIRILQQENKQLKEKLKEVKKILLCGFDTQATIFKALDILGDDKK